MYQGTWSTIKRETILTPEDFMTCLANIVPDLHEEDLIKVRRAERDKPWVRDICDFIWICMQENREYWQPEIARLWPGIKLIMDEQKLQDAFSELHF